MGERERILEEAAEMKKIAEWYHMPNKPIATTDALAGASNYFSRVSIPGCDDDDEHERVLEEAAELKKVADWYLHPEKKIEVDPAAYGRNYFGPTEDEDGELDDERERVLNELSELKKVADWHLHPEKKIEVDPAACGRNYFGLSEQDDDDELDDERERVLEEVSKLKKVAGWYLHPENKIEVDPAIFGRNYFGPSVHDDDDELVEERERVLEEVSKLKKVAGWHLYPESKIDVDYFHP